MGMTLKVRRLCDLDGLLQLLQIGVSNGDSLAQGSIASSGGKMPEPTHSFYGSSMSAFGGKADIDRTGSDVR